MDRQDLALKPGEPKVLFEGKFVQSERESVWDVAPDGQHFVMVQQDETTIPTQINIVLNWFEELEQKVPAPE